jgi:hypothetical protein
VDGGTGGEVDGEVPPEVRAPRLLGAHVEGPYFAAAQAGAQDPAHLRNPDDGSVDALLAYADVIRIVSYAPELPGAEALTRRLRRARDRGRRRPLEATDVDLAPAGPGACATSSTCGAASRPPCARAPGAAPGCSRRRSPRTT